MINTNSRNADLMERQLDVISKKLEISKKRIDIKDAKNSIKNDINRSLMDQISGLQRLMTDFVFDTENTIFASEPKFKNLLTDSEIKIVKSKLFTMIDKL